VPCVIGDGIRVQGFIISLSPDPTDSTIHSCSKSLALSGASSTRLGDGLRDVDVTSRAFKEMVYLIWLARRLYLDMRGAGAQEDVAFRPGDVVQVSLLGWRT
jgi:hypothetical protein